MDTTGLKLIEDTINERSRRELEKKRLEEEIRQKNELDAKAYQISYEEKQKREMPMRLRLAKTIFDWIDEFRKTTQCELLFKEVQNNPLRLWAEQSYAMLLSKDGTVSVYHWRRDVLDCRRVSSTSNELAYSAVKLSHLEDLKNRIISNDIYRDLLYNMGML